VVALLLAVRGAAALQVIVAYVVPNGAVVLLQPLLIDSRSLQVPVLELIVVLVVDREGHGELEEVARADQRSRRGDVVGHLDRAHQHASQRGIERRIAQPVTPDSSN
jgi:hypothetical protein